MYSLKFDGVDLSSYELIIIRRETPMYQIAPAIQLLDKSYADKSKIPPKEISLDVEITGATNTILKTNVDAIQQVLNTQEDGELILDVLNDRFWNARFVRLIGRYRYCVFDGTLDFICYDPMAYGVSEISNNYAINADPKTVTETTGGTAIISPVYTLTAGENRPTGNIKVKNNNTAEELIWNGAMTSGQQLVIDVAKYYVTKAGASAMSGVSGQFPRLTPGGGNGIVITGFGILGTLNITYRNRFA